jgi:hypothetical protein
MKALRSSVTFLISVLVRVSNTSSLSNTDSPDGVNLDGAALLNYDSSDFKRREDDCE